MRKIIFLLLATLIIFPIAGCSENRTNIDIDNLNREDIPEVIITDGMYEVIIDGVVLTLGESTQYDVFNIDTLKINNAFTRILPEGVLGPVIHDYLQDPSWFQEVIHKLSFYHDPGLLKWIPVEADYWIDERSTLLLSTIGKFPPFADRNEGATIGSRILVYIGHAALFFPRHELITDHNIDITFYKGVAVGTHMSTLFEKWGRPNTIADHFEDNILIEYTFRDLSGELIGATIRVCKETLEIGKLRLGVAR